MVVYKKAGPQKTQVMDLSARNSTGTPVYNSCHVHRHSYCVGLTFGELVTIITLNFVFSICGSTGNVLVCVVIRNSPSLRSTCDKLIANLAVADLCTTALVQPLLVVLLCAELRGVFLPDVDFAARVFAGFSASASLLTLMYMSTDRCLAIRNPLKHRALQSTENIQTAFGILWFLSVLALVLEVILKSSKRENLRSYLQATVVIICYFVITISCILTCVALKKRVVPVENLQTSQQDRESLEMSKRLAKTVVLIVCIFTACWVPFGFYSLKSPGNLQGIYLWLATVGLINSSLNSVVYFFRHKRYRQTLRRLFHCQRHPRVQPQITSQARIQTIYYR